MIAALEHAGREQARDVRGRDRAVADAPLRRDDLDQRLEPDHAARAVAHQLDRASAGGGLRCDRDGDLVRAERACRGVAGNVHAHRHDCRSFAGGTSTSASKRAGETRPNMRPSTVIAGPHAQLPSSTPARA
ncbi:MAG: hypothetical protein U0168_07735 [Nannocystaceae bacterium]